MDMSEEVFTEIKNVMNVISMLQLREKTFRKELEFFNQNYKKIDRQCAALLYIMALKRLEHEVGFLCVDTYSLHQGIEKKKSLYSKVIKQNGKLLSKIDNTPSDRSTFTFLGNIDSDGVERPFSSEEENDFIEQFEQEAYNSRKELRNNSGITSHKHDDLNEWINKILDDKILSQLDQYRNEFAHRLDSLENLKRELPIRHPQSIESIEQMLDIVSIVLTKYNDRFQTILGYTKSQHYLGVKGLKYDSLSRLKLADSMIQRKKLNNDNSSDIN